MTKHSTTNPKTNSAAKKKKKNKHRSYSLVTRMKESLSLNIGTIIFGAIFLYMAITLFLYFTSNKISTYQVVSGPLAKNQTYTGLVIREEQIIEADAPGYITYYAKDNAKVKQNGVIYSIGDSKSNSVSIELTDSALNTLRRKISSFSTNFNTIDYNDIYSFKYELEGSLLQNTGISAPSTSANTTLGNQTIYSSPSDGVVLYSIDGYEKFDTANISVADINKKSYHLTDLKTDGSISPGDPVYKLITDEGWSVYIPLTDKQVIQLGEKSSIRVKFLKDGVTQVANFDIQTNEDGSYWGKLNFSSGMIRYATERFLDIELVTNAQTGLKIPISSIVTKEFYVVPEEFAALGGNSDDLGFYILTDDSASTITEEEKANKNAIIIDDKKAIFHNLTIYEHQNGKYYIDPLDVEKGTVIQNGNATSRFIVGETATLEGVYCINKGYAVFRKIVIIDKNDEYCIVETGTDYGLSQFDHIVLDSSTVDEQEILY